ncbi:unnamed protein product [Prunus armeniaca]|uniref:Uncharacterized protein n=1 Tax=Prunus armeniaca TaxID=36596 RepID=A0A6J5TV63_PRUAR|nr:unnamed protein product [Prunus armeniaca]
MSPFDFDDFAKKLGNQERVGYYYRVPEGVNGLENVLEFNWVDVDVQEEEATTESDDEFIDSDYEQDEEGIGVSFEQNEDDIISFEKNEDAIVLDTFITTSNYYTRV